MNWITRSATAVAVTAGGVVVGRVVAARGIRGWPSVRTDDGSKERWHALTINRPMEEVAPGGELPEPLKRLGDSVEVRLEPAPGDKGTEVHVRLRAGEPSGLGGLAARLGGDDPRWPVRAALREARMLIETGEVLEPSRPATTKRTLTNRPLEYATAHGREEGLL